MDRKYTDIDRTLVLGREKMTQKFVLFFAAGLLIGLAMLFHYGPAKTPLPIWLLLAICGPMTAYQFFRTAQPGTPPLVLSPSGITMNLEFVKTFHVPWAEVKGVDQIDIDEGVGSYKKVAVFLVSRNFYNRVIHEDNIVLRGPGWSSNFVPNGEYIAVAMHDTLLPATSDELRTAVETRWSAFKAKTAPQAAKAS